jgi:hypothetical protein
MQWRSTILPHKIQRVPVGGAVELMLHGTETSSVFQDKNGNRCFLNVNRNDGKRKLNLVNVDDNWNADNDWMFLEVLFSPAQPILAWREFSFPPQALPRCPSSSLRSCGRSRRAVRKA